MLHKTRTYVFIIRIKLIVLLQLQRKIIVDTVTRYNQVANLNGNLLRNDLIDIEIQDQFDDDIMIMNIIMINEFVFHAFTN